MATGYDEDGIEDLICGAPPDAGAGGSVGGNNPENPGGRTTACGSTLPLLNTVGFFIGRPTYEGNFTPTWSGFLDEFKPNCMFWGWAQNFTAAGWLLGGTGTTDLSIEMWVKLRLDPTFDYGAGPPAVASRFPQAGIGLWSGFNTGAAVGEQLGFVSYGGQIRARFVDDLVAVEVNMTVPPGWHHLAINCARGGNLEAFVDGVSQGVAGGVTNYNWAANRSIFVFGVDTIGGVTESDRLGWNGPVAYHSALLTAAQLRDSVNNKYIQMTANTEWATDPAQLTWDYLANDWLYWTWVDNRVGAGRAGLGNPCYVIEDINIGTNSLVGLGTQDNLIAAVPNGCPFPAGAGFPTTPDLTGNGRDQNYLLTSISPVLWCSDPFWI